MGPCLAQGRGLVCCPSPRRVDRPVIGPIIGAPVPLIHRLFPAHLFRAGFEVDALRRMARDAIKKRGKALGVEQSHGLDRLCIVCVCVCMKCIFIGLTMR